LTSCSFTNCSTTLTDDTGGGGAIFFEGSAKFSLIGTSFDECGILNAGKGGAIFINMYIGKKEIMIKKRKFEREEKEREEEKKKIEKKQKK
jgi:hypothetical protein